MDTEQTPNGAPPADIEMKTEPMVEAESAPEALPPTLNPPAETPTPSGTATAAPTTPSHNQPQTPIPARVPTPSRSTPAAQVPPEKPNPHGSPTRVYLNQNVTPYLLEGMKQLAVLEPEKPLAWLAGFLDGKSREVEGS